MPKSTRDDIVSSITGLLMLRFPRIASSHVVETVGKEYDALADRPIQMYVSNLVEHAARSRLTNETVQGTGRRIDQVVLLL